VSVSRVLTAGDYFFGSPLPIVEIQRGEDSGLRLFVEEIATRYNNIAVENRRAARPERNRFMAHYGVWIGIGLVALATAIALLLGAKAARSVEQFRSEDHEMFTRKTRP
jgi:hypothetical protein